MRYNFDTLSAEEEKAALKVNMFEGDFGEQGDKVLKDKIVRAKKAHVCCHCNGQIYTLELYRYHVGKYSGRVMTYHWCTPCCHAMARVWTDQMDSLCDRLDLYEPHFDSYPTQEGLIRRHALRIQEKRYVPG